MAGGIFVERPWHPNPKCLIFAFILILLYWYLPRERNIFLVPIIFIVAYVAMAWYDFLYNCDEVMKSGSSLGPNTLDAIFKPQRRDMENEGAVEDQEGAYLQRVYLFHLIAIVPLLGYVGWKGSESESRAFPALLGASGLALLYHGTRLFYPRER